jgi:hypothetical protein
MANTKQLYPFKDKDPIIDVLRTLIETRSQMEGVSFRKVLTMIDEESNSEIKHATLYGWFNGPTMYPRYATVARLYLAMRAYSRRPISIGDKEANPINLIERKRA